MVPPNRRVQGHRACCYLLAAYQPTGPVESGSALKSDERLLQQARTGRTSNAVTRSWSHASSSVPFGVSLESATYGSSFAGDGFWPAAGVRERQLFGASTRTTGFRQHD